MTENKSTSGKLKMSKNELNNSDHEAFANSLIHHHDFKEVVLSNPDSSMITDIDTRQSHKSGSPFIKWTISVENCEAMLTRRAPEPFRLDLSPEISDEGKDIAEKELRETPENVAAGLKELRELLAKDDTIFYDTDDATLLIFLRPCKFYAKSAYELMKRVADFREKYKDNLNNLMPADEKDAFFNHNVVNVLKNLDHKGRRVMIVNCGGSWNTSKVTSDQLFRIFYLIHIASTLEVESQIRGVVVIMDFDGLGLKQVAALNPVFSMKLLGFIQDAMPMRLKEVHMVKQPFIFKMVWKIFSPFVKEKLKKRIFFHGSDMKSLQQHIPATHLPADYKGELDKIDYTGKDWYPAIDSHMDYFKKWTKWGLKKN